MRFKINKQDAWASALLCALGLFVVVHGSSYSLGTLSRMGPGFFPVALGVLLIFLGVLNLFTSGQTADDESDETLTAPPDWRGWLCIIGGVVAFIAVGKYGGLIPATLALVFISALGDRTHTLLSALALAVFVTILGVVIFSWGLDLQFPLFRWG